jgi:hypothetical protein
MKSPIRFSIVNQLMKNAEGRTPEQIYDAIKDNYKGERSCSVRQIDSQCMSLKGAGLCEEVDATEENDDVMVTYAITEYGRDLANKWLTNYLD